MPAPDTPSRKATIGGGILTAGWGLMALPAVAIGVFSLRYGLPRVPQPVLTNFVTHRVALSVHAVVASVALLVGPTGVFAFLAVASRSAFLSSA